MKYVIGVDLGTSAVKILLVNQDGNVTREVSKPLNLIQEKTGYSEQNAQDWVDRRVVARSCLKSDIGGEPEASEGISLSGQLHGLDLVDERHHGIRPAILWNDTRTTQEREDIYEVVGKNRLLEGTKTPALEEFTLA